MTKKTEPTNMTSEQIDDYSFALIEFIQENDLDPFEALRVLVNAQQIILDSTVEATE